MTNDLSHDDQTYPEWHWPITFSNYNCDPALTSLEQAELSRLRQLRESGIHALPPSTQSPLQRLITPMNDALAHLGTGKLGTSFARGFIIREMVRRETTFWQWTPEEWIESLRGDRAAGQHYSSDVGQFRQPAVGIAYLLTDFTDFHLVKMYHLGTMANRVFGVQCVTLALEDIQGKVRDLGYNAPQSFARLPQTICNLLLFNRSPHVKDLTTEVLEKFYHSAIDKSVRTYSARISRALANSGAIEYPVKATLQPRSNQNRSLLKDVPPEWADWCQRWHDTSLLAPALRKIRYYQLLKIGRWLAQNYPGIVSPDQWTRDLAIAYVTLVCQLKSGDWGTSATPRNRGLPLSSAAQASYLATMRGFIRDCQRWEWIPIRFEPARALSTPRNLKARLLPNPRVIADDVWAKLLWAGLNLTVNDLIHQATQQPPFPFAMIRALVIVWLFAGLRSDEIHRLSVGCIRWQTNDQPNDGDNAPEPKRKVCLLTVPVNKTSGTFVKPVDILIGEAIRDWEQLRPVQRLTMDQKTGTLVHYLFMYRGKHIAKDYLNSRLIPLLCDKAGVPLSDARGRITSHRARSTIATQLFNAKNPMSLFELQAWLGHSSPASTQQYARINPVKLTQSYRDAGYFEANLRMVNVLIDLEVVKTGAAAAGEPWMYYDLGHGYCTHEFFDQCPHRMACARCDFYVPKASSRAQLLEAKANLRQMMHKIPLTEDERAAVEDGLQAVETLCAKLTDVPTPSGSTPRQLGTYGASIIPITEIK